ncbi:hypothetical protein DFS34DRAFT_589324 [Phlyctochytrium arcticum]|nr:hypothetical protein DFS34DRAFT_589324 [Phlyctochytrium arcticum]
MHRRQRSLKVYATALLGLSSGGSPAACFQCRVRALKPRPRYASSATNLIPETPAVASLRPTPSVHFDQNPALVKEDLSIKNLKSLLQHNNLDRFVRVFISMHKEGKGSPQMYATLLEACHKIGDHETLLQLLPLITQLGVQVPPDVIALVVKSVIAGPDPINNLMKLLQVFANPEKHTPGDVVFYMAMAKGLLLSDDPQYGNLASAILEKVADQSTNQLFTSLQFLASTYGKSAESTLALVRSAPVTESPIAKAYAALALSRHPDSTTLAEAELSFRELVSKATSSPDFLQHFQLEDVIIELCSRLMAGYLRTENLNSAMELRQFIRPEIGRSQLSTSTRDRIYRAVDAGVLRIIRRTLRAMPNSESTLAKRKSLHQTWTRIAEDLRYRKVVRDIRTSYSLLDLYIQACSDGFTYMPVVATIFDRMKHEGLAPNVVIYNLMMKGWESALDLTPVEKIASIRSLWNAMERAGIQPNADSYSAIFGAYASDWRGPEISRRERVKARNQLREYDVQMAERNIKHHQGSSFPLLEALAALDIWLLIPQRLSEMHLSGIAPSLSLYKSILRQCALSRKANAAQWALTDFWFTMQRQFPKSADAETYTLMLRCCQIANEPIKALRFLEDMQRRGFAPSEDNLRTILSVLEGFGGLAARERARILALLPQ